jgi:hypothetical protein
LFVRAQRLHAAHTRLQRTTATVSKKVHLYTQTVPVVQLLFTV